MRLKIIVLTHPNNHSRFIYSRVGGLKAMEPWRLLDMLAQSLIGSASLWVWDILECGRGNKQANSAKRREAALTPATQWWEIMASKIHTKLSQLCSVPFALHDESLSVGHLKVWIACFEKKKEKSLKKGEKTCSGKYAGWSSLRITYRTPIEWHDCFQTPLCSTHPSPPRNRRRHADPRISRWTCRFPAWKSRTSCFKWDEPEGGEGS